ncbi:Acetylcholinesterase [Hypsibius exemplaris]|uniref:Carboxylic ester hydrolase n=1 Tax=Hypsibius exemplaris TaxID=2072580 RepID=A0A9X6N8Z2_HYPEX|nr:Acetylcholinesterase [Hypsibius exemplaris]
MLKSRPTLPCIHLQNLQHHVLSSWSSSAVAAISLLAPQQHHYRALLLFLLLFLAPAWARDPLLVKTSKGLVRGFTSMSAHGKQADAFFGIPFAQPPVDDLRFKRPLPNEPWEGVFNATKPPNSCYQALDTTFGDFVGSNMWNANTELSEDCLYLNVWIPRPRPTNAAVMIWFYGGGFYSGSMTLDIYDGSTLATEENVIVVAFQYRVGSLGFLYLGTEDAPGNAAMYDQIEAMRWVRENIRAFGGNPQNITIFGESAGATSISLHTLSPVSMNLFNQAILSSGSATCPWAALTAEVALNRAVKLTKRLQCLHAGETLAKNMPEIVKCLRKVPANEIVDKELVTDGFMDFPFVPVIDGEFLPARPDSILKSGGFKRSNIMMGSVSEEGTFWVLYHFEQLLGLKNQVHMSHDELITSLENVFSNFSRVAMDAIIFQYTDWVHPNDPINNVDLLEKAVGDYFFTCNVNEMAWSYAQAGQNIHMYTFNHQSSNLPWPKWTGVPHGYEIEYIFGWPLDPKRGYTREEVELSKRMMNHWANFAKTGNPSLTKEGGYSKHSWPVYTLHGKEHLMLNTKDPVIKRGVRATQCAFWKKYMPQLMSMTADIDEVEAQWKTQFHEWNTRYIVDWKAQFDRYVRHTNKLQSHNIFGHGHDDL